MYEELVKMLRVCGDSNNSCGNCQAREDDGSCPYGEWEFAAEKYMLQAADAIEELSKRVNESIPKADAEIIIAEVAKPRWIPVTKRLPSEELAFYLCYTDAGIVVECLWTNNKYGLGPFGDWGWRLMDVPQYQKVTHWMPLPEPPKEETE